MLKELIWKFSISAVGCSCSHCATEILLTMVIISYSIVFTNTGGKYQDINKPIFSPFDIIARMI